MRQCSHITQLLTFFVKEENRRVGGYLLIILIFIGFSGCYPQSTETFSTQQKRDFLEHYWSRPLDPQGNPPPPFNSIETALNPATCGNCHPTQWTDWQKSLHRRAMGAGILGQLVNLPTEATEEHQVCLRCHAPLNEQAKSLMTLLSHNTVNNMETPLHEQGVMCAVCHLREFQWYGPPRQDGSQPNGDLTQFPHNAWQSHPAFSDSQFCAACHQFKQDEYTLNGKLLENTYQEWQQSRYQKEGITCQKCHLPQRRHLWRGIHDPDMTKTGIDIQVQNFKISTTHISAELSIKNSGTGHYFPTYVTPKVIVQGYQENQQGQPLSHTLQQYVIHRQVTIDLSEEISDTRLAPDEQLSFYYYAQIDSKATALIFYIRVEPDAFYTEFYQTLLEQKLAGMGQQLIEQAFKDSQKSMYTLYLNKLPLATNH
ncbi:MAG: hypothetical protein BWK79_02595 [Beggiatoa sp. IS2]|nr:MAG: hypothetical protein BWK79_02595 [Beggiatoa sp. IS2]